MLTAQAVAADCPPAPDVEAELDTLIAQANGAENFTQGREASDAMWRLWLRAPDQGAQDLLDRGMRRRDVFDLLGAYGDFTALTDYCPDYAEGWNQRAFVSYLREDYAAALVDLDRALELQPRHVGAQSGRGLTLMQMGRLAEARKQMLEAVDNNPWLGEAALLEPGQPLGPEGEDI
ncbi:tetratricopeptide repeat protein [Sulfitobacter sp. HNIBRBA3233]|uniref:tetratricopeptide repeat protein n=1 Tax=Sulfitobacter marinivivus TaxID=3158558 RepID=UPI0032DFCBD4